MEAEAIPFTYAIAGSINGEDAALRIEGSVGTNEVRFQGSCRVKPTGLATLPA